MACSATTERGPCRREAKPGSDPPLCSVHGKGTDQSARCSATTARGRACRQWAVRGSDPPLCSIHCGWTTGGAKRWNRNATKHGFYSAVLRPEELAELVAEAQPRSLEDEIGVVRVATRRVMEALNEEPGTLEVERLAARVFEGARTVARLLRDMRVIGGDAAEGIIVNLTKILAELGEELGGQFVDG